MEKTDMSNSFIYISLVDSDYQLDDSVQTFAICEVNHKDFAGMKMQLISALEPLSEKAMIIPWMFLQELMKFKLS